MATTKQTTSEKASRPTVVGQTVWLFDSNRRHYETRDGAKVTIYAEHWVETTVTKAGRVNLTTASHHTLRREGDGFRGHACHVVFSREEMEADIWRHEHAYKIEDAVRRCDDVAILKQIAALVGYDETRGGA